MATSPGPFKVDRVPRVTEQIRAFARKAELVGRKTEIVAALQEIISRLQADPITFGDPEHRTHHAGGMVNHAIVTPLVVRFAVYEAERAVLILNLRPLPGSFLEE